MKRMFTVILTLRIFSRQPADTFNNKPGKVAEMVIQDNSADCVELAVIYKPDH